MTFNKYCFLEATCYLLTVVHVVHPFTFDLPQKPAYLLPVSHQVMLPSSKIQPLHRLGTSSMMEGILQWILPVANAEEGSIITLEEAVEPTEEEIAILKDAMNALYDEQNFVKAEPLLTRAISMWETKPAFERNELYHLRGNCYMYLRRPAEALKDYDKVVKYLETEEGAELTPQEDKQSLFLAIARALRSKGVLSSDINIAKKQQAEAARNYELAFKYLSNENIENDEDREIMAYMKNPFAAWEYSDAIRGSGDYTKASILHQIASDAFANAGDRARARISDLDSVIDLVADNNIELAQQILDEILASKDIVGRDIKLLQRVIAKEGEARIALAAVLWNSNDKPSAEAQRGEACVRFEQLEAQYLRQQSSELSQATSRKAKTDTIETLGYSIDDLPGAGEISWDRFKDDKFVSETLRWPEALSQKLLKLENLGK